VIVRMLFSMSSGRHDGRVWPLPGVNFEVPDWEGEDLVKGGNAVMVVGADTEPVSVLEPEPVPVPEPEPVEAETEVEPEPVSAGGPPRPAAPKAEWIEWAIQQGADQIAAENATKQQLMEIYGQRP